MFKEIVESMRRGKRLSKLKVRLENIQRTYRKKKKPKDGILKDGLNNICNTAQDVPGDPG